VQIFEIKRGQPPAPAGQIRKPASPPVCLPPPPPPPAFDLQYVEGSTATDGKIMPEGFILPSAGKTSISFGFCGPIKHPLILSFYLFIILSVYALNLISIIFLS
jgi:hypothetical protein